MEEKTVSQIAWMNYFLDYDIGNYERREFCREQITVDLAILIYLWGEI